MRSKGGIVVKTGKAQQSPVHTDGAGRTLGGLLTAWALILSAVLAFSGAPVQALAAENVYGEVGSVSSGELGAEASVSVPPRATVGPGALADPVVDPDALITSDGDVPGPETPTPEVLPLTIAGVDFMQPSSTSWEVLRVDDLGERTLYLDITRQSPDGSTTSLLKRAPYTSTASDNGDLGKEVAQIITLDLAGTTPAAALGDAYHHDTYQVSVYAERRGGALLYQGSVYPVYAKLQDGDTVVSYELLGTRTASADELASPKNAGVGDVFYKESPDGTAEAFVRVALGDAPVAPDSPDTPDTPETPDVPETPDTPDTSTNMPSDPFVVAPESAASVDNTFDETLSAFVVPYEKQGVQALVGSVRYVDDQGNLVKESFVRNFENGVTQVRVEESFLKADNDNPEISRYYRTLSGLGGTTVTLTAANAHAVVRVVEVEGMTESDYAVTLRYIDENDALLWSDTVDVKGYGYQYTLPTTFSMLESEGVELYTLQRVEGAAAPADTLATQSRVATRDWNIPTIKFDGSVDPERDFLTDEQGKYYVNARYTSSTYEGKATLTLVAIDGSTGDPLPQDFQPAPLEIAPDTSAYYEPHAQDINGVTYVPWSGNIEPITYTWADLAQGIDLLQYLYYVPEGYAPDEAYDVTVQYVNIANNAVLRTDTHSISSDLSGYITLAGEERFTTGGHEYVRLAGQERGIRHGYYSPGRLYTVYYRDVNDVINADVVITRTQIIETERVVAVPGETITTTTTLPGTVTTITTAPVTLPTITTPPTTTGPVATDTPASAGGVDGPAGTDAGVDDTGAGTNTDAGTETGTNTGTAPDVGADTSTPEVTETGVSQGDGTTIINDDENPLANQAGQTTTEERIIEDNPTPLAAPDGVISDDGSGLPFDHGNRDLVMILVSVAGAGVAGAAAWLLIRRNQLKRKYMNHGSDRADQ